MIKYNIKVRISWVRGSQTLFKMFLREGYLIMISVKWKVKKKGCVVTPRMAKAPYAMQYSISTSEKKLIKIFTTPNPIEKIFQNVFSSSLGFFFFQDLEIMRGTFFKRKNARTKFEQTVMINPMTVSNRCVSFLE